MADLQSFLRDLDDLDDFPTNANQAPLVFGYDSKDMIQDLTNQIKMIRELGNDGNSPLGRAMMDWMTSGFSRSPHEVNNQAGSNKKTLQKTPSLNIPILKTTSTDGTSLTTTEVVEVSLTTTTMSQESNLDCIPTIPDPVAADPTETATTTTASTTTESSQKTAVDREEVNTDAMVTKFTLCFFLHEISKLILHTKDVNLQYRKMKEELFLSTNTVTSSYEDILSLSYANTITTMFRNQDIYNNRVNAQIGSFLYQTQRNDELSQSYTEKQREIIKKALNFQQHVYDFLNDIYLYPKNAAAVSAAAVSPNSQAEEEVIATTTPAIIPTFETFIENHDHISMLYAQLFMPSLTSSSSTPSSSSMTAMELSKSFFSTWMWNIKIVLNSLVRQRKTLLPSVAMKNRPIPSDRQNSAAKKESQNKTNQSLKNDAGGYATSMTTHSELECTIANARYLFALARFTHMNATRIMKNGREYDDFLRHYHGHHRNGFTITSMSASKEMIEKKTRVAIHPHAKITRSYTGTILLETETIEVIEESPTLTDSETDRETDSGEMQTKTQYIRHLELCFDEKKKKNDLNTTFFSDETNMYMMLCQRFQRENIPIGLFRNILTSKKLAMTYYSNNEYVMQTLFKLFLNEVIKYPSYLLLHAMILDLMEGVPIGVTVGGLSPSVSTTNATVTNDDNASVGSASSTGGNSMKSGRSTTSLNSEQGSSSNNNPTRMFPLSRGVSTNELLVNTNTNAVNTATATASGWTWSKLVPRKKLENIPSINTTATASSSNNKAISIHSHAAMRDFLLDDVLLPIAVEGVENGNKELLSWFNSLSKMSYFFDEVSVASASDHAANNQKTVVDLKCLLLDKEYHILYTWLLQRGLDLNKTSLPVMEDPVKSTTFLMKQLLPKLVDLCLRWYGINLFETFDHLRPGGGSGSVGTSSK